MLNTTNLKYLDNLLKKELNLSNQLLEILQNEYVALSKNNHSGFLELLEKKKDCTVQLQETEHQLTHFLETKGYTSNKQDIEKLINTLPIKIKKVILPLWQSLQKAAQQCKQQNEINGRTINLAHIKTKQALALLGGHDNTSSLYDQSGKTDDRGNSPSIAIV